MPLKFTDAMEDCAKVYGKPMASRTVRAYARALRGLDLSQCADALLQLSAESQYFPRPCQIIEAVGRPEPKGPRKAPLDDWLIPSDEAWKKLRAAIERGAAHFDFADHLAQRALEERGFASYAKLRGASMIDWTRAELMFARHYSKHGYLEFLNAR